MGIDLHFGIEKIDILKLLIFMQERLEIGEDLNYILNNYIKNYIKNNYFVKQRVVRIFNNVKKGVPLADALKEESFIDNIEYFVLQTAKEASVGLQIVVDMKEEQKGIGTALTKIAWNYSFIPFTFISMGYSSDTFVNLTNTIGQIRGMGVPPQLPFYLQNPDIILYVGWGSLWLAISFVGLLVYLYNNSPAFVYRVYKYKEIEDGLFITASIESLYKGGNTLHKCFELIEKEMKNKALKRMLNKINIAFKSGKLEMSSNLKKVGFSADVFDKFELIESGGNEAKHLANAVKTLRVRKERVREYTENQIPMLIKYTAFAIGMALVGHMMLKMLDTYIGIN